MILIMLLCSYLDTFIWSSGSAVVSVRFSSFGEWTAFSDEPIDDNLTFVVSNQLFLFFADKFAFRRWLNITKVLSGMNICCLGVDSFF